MPMQIDLPCDMWNWNWNRNWGQKGTFSKYLPCSAFAPKFRIVLRLAKPKVNFVRQQAKQQQSIYELSSLSRLECQIIWLRFHSLLGGINSARKLMKSWRKNNEFRVSQFCSTQHNAVKFVCCASVGFVLISTVFLFFIFCFLVVQLVQVLAEF